MKPDVSSEGLLDIAIESSTDRDALMIIDSVSVHNSFSTIFSFILVVFFVCMIGFASPEELKRDAQMISTEESQELLEIPISISNLSTLMREVSLSFVLVRENGESEEHHEGTFRVQIDIGNETVTHTVNEPYVREAQIHFRRNHKWSREIKVFRSRLLKFTNLDMSMLINVSYPGVTGVNLILEYGDAGHSYLEIAFRSIFFVLMVSMLISFIREMKSTPYETWQLEQQLLVSLLATTAMFNNPLYILHMFIPSVVYNISNTFTLSMYGSFLTYYILTLQMNSRLKEKGDFCGENVTKVIVTFLVFVSTTVKHLLDEIDNNSKMGDVLEIVSYTLVLLHFIFTSVYSSFHINRAEHYKLSTYTLAGMISFTMLLGSKVILHLLRISSRGSLEFVVSNAVQNVLALMMCWLHWPYSLSKANYMNDLNEHPDVIFSND